jgi:hypothetical protein
MSPYIHETLARERQQMLLAEAAADRHARQARAQRRQHGAPATCGSPLRRRPAWLPLSWRRLLTRRLRPAGRRATLHDSVAGGADA